MEREYAPAQFKLGELYAVEACGVSQDRTKSIAYFKKAADQGHRQAQERLKNG
jgi:TPR repeat protein